MVKKVKPTAKRNSKAYVYFMAAVRVIYMRDEALKERDLNVLLEMPSMDILKKDLATIQQAAMERLKMENDVTPDMVKDAVILNVMPLAHATPAVFHGEDGAAAQLPQ